MPHTTYRISLDESDFDDLTSGKVFREKYPDGTTVEMILSDIGYERMIEILQEKLRQL